MTVCCRAGRSRRSSFASGSSPSRWRCWRSRRSNFGEDTMTQLELLDGVVRGSAFLEQLTGRPVTVIGKAREAAAVAKTLQTAGAEVRMEPVATRVDLTGN